MKTLAILLLLPVLCQAFFNHEIVLRRAKRAATTYSDWRVLGCMSDCLMAFAEDMGPMEGSNDTVFWSEDLLNKESLDEICLSYKKMDACLSECDIESSETAQAIVGVFDLFETICSTHYDELVSYLPCYSASVNPINQKCATTCGDPNEFSTKVETEMENQISSKNEDDIYKAINGVMDETCDFASCHLRCQSEVIVETCSSDIGENAADFNVAFAEQGVQSVSKALNVLAPQIVIPEDCVDRE